MKVVEDIRKLTVSGGKTYCITLPRSMIKGLKWKKGEKKLIKLEKDGIFIKDWK